MKGSDEATRQKKVATGYDKVRTVITDRFHLYIFKGLEDVSHLKIFICDFCARKLKSITNHKTNFGPFVEFFQDLMISKYHVRSQIMAIIIYVPASRTASLARVDQGRKTFTMASSGLLRSYAARKDTNGHYSPSNNLKTLNMLFIFPRANVNSNKTLKLSGCNCPPCLQNKIRYMLSILLSRELKSHHPNTGKTSRQINRLGGNYKSDTRHQENGPPGTGKQGYEQKRSSDCSQRQLFLRRSGLLRVLSLPGKLTKTT